MIFAAPCILCTKRGALALVALAALAAGCSRPLPPPAAGPPPREEGAAPEAVVRLEMEPIKLQGIAGTGVPGISPPELEVLDATALFDRGGRLLSARQYELAIRQYDLLLQHFPDSRFASPALYNAGLCHEWRQEFDKAAERYQTLIRRFGGQKEAIDASFRLGGCLAELHNWPASAEVFGTLAAGPDLSAADRIESMARKGLAHFRLGDQRAARSSFQGAIDFHGRLDVSDRLDSDFFVAMAHYHLAALPHVEFRNVKVDTGKGMARTLDEKARFLLLSQVGYIRTIKTKNPYWATAAGFQIGSLYREFYTTLLTALPDFSKEALKNASLAGIPLQQARSQLIEVYMEEVHKAVKPLLQKAIRIFETNVTMAEQVGVESNWVGKSRHQVNELKHLLSLPPGEAVRLVQQDGPLPEDQTEAAPPAGAAGPGGSPAPEQGQGQDRPQAPATTPPPAPPPAPARPSDRPVQEPGEEPGKVIL